MLLNLGFQLKMKSYPSMIIILSGSLLGYLFFSLYTSDLTAKMTANPPPMPIRYRYVLVDVPNEFILKLANLAHLPMWFQGDTK